jgi:hypothetical protein
MVHKVTIKDIAQKCNISNAVASAALRNKTGTVAYSQKTQELVWKVAAELNYRPNRMAQAMRTGVVPLVALCVHIEKEYQDEVNLYIHDLLPSIAYKLQENYFETIFVPYNDSDELIKRIQYLIEDNLTNGIISNFPTKKTVDYLKKTGIPFVMLGNVDDKSAPAVDIENSIMFEKLAAYGQEHGFRETVWVLAHPTEDNILWDSVLLNPLPEKRAFKDLDLHSSDILWATAGEFTRRILLKEYGISDSNIIAVENKRIMIQSRPALFVHDKLKDRAILASELLMEWIKTGKPPELRQQQLKLLPEDLEFIL